MTKEILLKKLKEMGIRDNYYSLDGELKPDATIVRKHKRKYEVFYMDDRGGIHCKTVFYTIDEAYERLLKELEDLKDK